MTKIRLLKIIKSPKSDKKWRALFLINDIKEKTTDFGQKGFSDYTLHKDKERRNRYINRHMKDTQTKDPTRAGYLSLYILWNKPSFNGSVRDYKKRLSIYNKTKTFPIKII